METLSKLLSDMGFSLLSTVLTTSEEKIELLSKWEQQTGIDFSTLEDLQTNPEATTKLKDLEEQYLHKLSNTFFDSSKPRDTQVTITKTDDGGTTIYYRDTSINYLYILGFFLVAFSLCYIVALTWIPIPEDNIRFADTSLGFILGTVVSTIVNYFFGSNLKKSDMKANVIPKK